MLETIWSRTDYRDLFYKQDPRVTKHVSKSTKSGAGWNSANRTQICEWNSESGKKQGAFYSTKHSGVKFWVFNMTNGTVFSCWSSGSKFRVKKRFQNKQKSKRRTLNCFHLPIDNRADAIAKALFGLNDLGRSVTPIFLLMYAPYHFLFDFLH